MSIEDAFLDKKPQTDPTEYSPLPPKKFRWGDEVNDSYPNRLVHSEEGQWVEVLNHPVSQQAISRMLKGILNVSDIVRIEEGDETHFLSRALPLEDIKGEHSDHEVYADLALLALVFGDKDHFAYVDNGYVVRARNAQVHNKRIAYFDFESPYDNFFEEMSVKDQKTYFKILSPESLVRLEEKLLMLQERFAGEEGEKFLTAIVHSSGLPVFDQTDRGGYEHRGLFAPPKEETSVEPTRYLLDFLRARIATTIELIRQQKAG